MSLPLGFKKKQSLDLWLRDHEGHVIRDEIKSIRSESDLHQQVWKVCDTCKAAILLDVRHSWAEEIPCTNYHVGDDDAEV